MNEATARALDDELRGILRDAGFGWLAQQVDEVASEGVYVVKARGRRGWEEEQAVEKAADARRGEIGTRPLSPEERLQLLINASIAALTQAPQLEDEIQHTLLAP